MLQEAPLGEFRDRFQHLRALNGLLITVDEMDEILRHFLKNAILKVHEIPERDKVKPREQASSAALANPIMVLGQQRVRRTKNI